MSGVVRGYEKHTNEVFPVQSTSTLSVLPLQHVPNIEYWLLISFRQILDEDGTDFFSAHQSIQLHEM